MIQKILFSLSTPPAPKRGKTRLFFRCFMQHGNNFSVTFCGCLFKSKIVTNIQFGAFFKEQGNSFGVTIKTACLREQSSSACILAPLSSSKATVSVCPFSAAHRTAVSSRTWISAPLSRSKATVSV